MSRLLLWAAVLGLMTFIFIFSDQPGPESDKLTEAAAMPIAEMIAAARSGDDGAFVLHVYNISGTIMRKAAHIAEYAVLGLLLRLLFQSYGKPWLALPAAIGVAYAIADELHQTFVPGRSGSIMDVLIDVTGMLIGVWCAVTIIDRRRKQHVHDQ